MPSKQTPFLKPNAAGDGFEVVVRAGRSYVALKAADALRTAEGRREAVKHDEIAFMEKAKARLNAAVDASNARIHEVYENAAAIETLANKILAAEEFVQNIVTAETMSADFRDEELDSATHAYADGEDPRDVS